MDAESFFQWMKVHIQTILYKHKVKWQQQTKVSEHLPRGVINLFDTNGLLIFYASKTTQDGAFPLQLIFPVMGTDFFQMFIISFAMKGIAGI